MNSFNATLQTKNRMYYCVISYKDSTGKWKLAWRTTKVLAKKGNKKKAKEKFPKIIKDFKDDLEQKETKEKEDKNSYERRIESYKNTPFTIFIAESIEEFKITLKKQHTIIGKVLLVKELIITSSHIKH